MDKSLEPVTGLGPHSDMFVGSPIAITAQKRLDQIPTEEQRRLNAMLTEAFAHEQFAVDWHQPM